MEAPRRFHAYLWDTEMLLVADGLTASTHRHSAVQVMLGVEGPLRTDFGGGWVPLPGVVVGPGVPHAFDGSGGLVAGGWVEAEGRVGEALRALLDDEAGWLAVPADVAGQAAAKLAPCVDERIACDEAARRWREALGGLVGESASAVSALDERLLPALDLLRRAPAPSPTIDELAEACHLSSSRFQHLFTDEVGVPPSRYLLWHRVLNAIELLVGGAGATEAAHAVGFADGPHLSRTTKEMTGVSPSDLAAMIGRAATNCRRR